LGTGGFDVGLIDEFGDHVTGQVFLLALLGLLLLVDLHPG